MSFLIMRNFHFLDKLKVFSIENSNMSMFTNNILIECGQVNPMRAFIVGFCEASREVVGEGTRINCKPWLACLVSDGIPYV